MCQGIEVVVAHTDAESVGATLRGVSDRLTVRPVESAPRARERARDADAVVSQYRLPSGDGLELLRGIREDHSELPFVLCAGSGSETVASEAIDAGVTDYVPTADPDTESVAETVLDAVETHRQRRRAARRAGAVETTNSGVAIIDEEGRFVDLNEAYGEIVGVEPSALIGRQWQTTIPDDRVDELAETLERELAAHGEWSGETVGQRADGSTYPKAFSAARLGAGGYVCVTRDITDRKRRERDRERTNALLSTLLNELPAGVLVESGDREILSVNERLLDLFSLEPAPEELVGADCRALTERLAEQFTDPERFCASVEGLIEGDSEQLREELELADGRTFERSYRPIDGPDEPCHLWVYRDITERVTRQAELVRTNERLDRFASIVSHDLRGPLNVIDGSLALAEDGDEQADLERCRRAVDRMDELLADLLSLARQGDAIDETETVELPAVVEDTLTTIGTRPGAVELRTDRTIEADRSRLQELLSNLFTNAVEHGGEGVTVTVGDLPDGFYVADDGSGIPADERADVFDPGYTTAEDGTGFGLDIVERIAEGHGWSVTVTGSDDDGARFEVRGVDVSARH